MNLSREQLKQAWSQAIIKLLMLPANAILGNGESKEKDGDSFLIRTIPLAIITLSLASITNMASRAYDHHHDYSSYATGLGLAILVPIIVYAALRVKSSAGQAFAWVSAIAFAFASGSIQFQIYNAGQPLTFSTLMSAGVNLEALSFGYGVPFAECVLAVLEGILIWQHEAKRTQAAQAVEDEAKRQAEEAKRQAEEAQVKVERKRREDEAWRAEQERKQAEWQAEQDRKAADHAQALELQRLKAEAKLHKPMHNDAQSVVQNSTPTTGRTENDAQPPVQNDRKKQAKQLHSEGFSIAEISRLTGAHRNSISAWVKETNGVNHH